MDKKTIVFDLDGVLCEYKGWRGHSKFGKPNLEMIILVRKLDAQGHYILKLCTTRLNPFPFGKDKWDMEVRSGEAYKRVYGFLSDNDIEKCFTEISGYKPFADYYIDDRAIRYSHTNDKYGGKIGVDLYQLLLSRGT